MNTPVGLPLNSILVFILLVITQVAATSLLPRTAGFTNLYWTVGCLGIFALSYWCLAQMIHRGMPLSLLIPILAAVVPLAMIGVGPVLYKEAASAAKIALLCLACATIGLASAVN